MAKIVLYSKPNCSMCMLTASILDKNNVTYEVTKDLDKVKAAAEKADSTSLPILQIDESYFGGQFAVMKSKEIIGGASA